MRDLLNILNAILSEESNLSALKTQIIGQVNKTEDAELLQKIYTVLNKTNLVDRIGLVLDRDTDTKGYVKQLTDMIIDVPGTYEEKAEFVNGYPHGYVDINKMLSGDYVKFDDLLKGDKNTPIAFVRRVFDSLKQVTFGGAKGPGEFALAVLSPHIKITGKGDLNIENKTVEVKASATGKGGGRIGTPGLLRTDNIVEIISKYIPLDNIPQSLNLKQLGPLMDSAGLDDTKKKKMATELFTYIFKGETDIKPLVAAVTSGQDPMPFFIKSNYELYQKESRFDGMMLMNFPAQTLKYYTDPLQMSKEIYSATVYLISSNPGFQSRQILSQITLRPSKDSTENIPGTTADTRQPPLKSASTTADLDRETARPRLTGPGAKAARSQQAPRDTPAVLGREKRRR